MELESNKTAGISVDLEKVLAFEPVDAAEEPAVRVQLTNGSTITLQGNEDVQTFKEAVEEYLKGGG